MSETTEAPRNWRRSDFRIIRGAGGNYKVQYYGTKEKRDAAAQIFADRDGTNVITELWDASHDQGVLNEGWGCDGHREPRVITMLTEAITGASCLAHGALEVRSAEAILGPVDILELQAQEAGGINTRSRSAH